MVLHPNVGPTLASLAVKFPKPSEVRIAAGATVLLTGSGLVVEALDVEGTLIINACEGANVGTLYHPLVSTHEIDMNAFVRALGW